ncbi:glycosyltransferase family 4 protein [Croceiramulus getboli]|nr:glycosyltransferase family 4 protein [Flavobacteriaceae bacterium YJPT1-3]
MRVIQLIDSLALGGAERVAVNFANALADQGYSSFLCTSRKEGPLKKALHQDVGYLYLNRKSTLDRAALRRLHEFVQSNDIEIIHAHTTSFFLAYALSRWNPQLNLIWHVHHGGYQHSRSPKQLLHRWLSKRFETIITVNEELKQWAESRLGHHKVYYLPNFASHSEESLTLETLEGEAGKRLVCVANWRPEKNHSLLFKALDQVLVEYPDWTLHLFGNRPDTAYAKVLSDMLQSNNRLQEGIIDHGAVPGVSHHLHQFDLAVLSSFSEGLPMTLLEYGLAGLPVVCTNVGQCAEVLGDSGQLVPSDDVDAMQQALIRYIADPELRKQHGAALRQRIQSQYEAQKIMGQLVDIYEQIIA